MSNLGRGVNWSAFQHIASMFAKAGEAKAAGIQGMAEGISGGIRMIGAKREQRRQEAIQEEQRKEQIDYRDRVFQFQKDQAAQQMADRDRRVALEVDQSQNANLWRAYEAADREVRGFGDITLVPAPVLEARNRALQTWAEHSKKLGSAMTAQAGAVSTAVDQAPAAPAATMKGPGLVDGMSSATGGAVPALQDMRFTPSRIPSMPGASMDLEDGISPPAIGAASTKPQQPEFMSDPRMMARMERIQGALGLVGSRDKHREAMAAKEKALVPGQKMPASFFAPEIDQLQGLGQMMDSISLTGFSEEKRELRETLARLNKNPSPNDYTKAAVDKGAADLQKLDFMEQALRVEAQKARQQIDAEINVRRQDAERLLGKQAELASKQRIGEEFGSFQAWLAARQSAGNTPWAASAVSSVQRSIANGDMTAKEAQDALESGLPKEGGAASKDRPFGSMSFPQPRRAAAEQFLDIVNSTPEPMKPKVKWESLHPESFAYIINARSYGPERQEAIKKFVEINGGNLDADLTEMNQSQRSQEIDRRRTALEKIINSTAEYNSSFADEIRSKSKRATEFIDELMSSFGLRATGSGGIDVVRPGSRVPPPPVESPRPATSFAPVNPMKAAEERRRKMLDEARRMEQRNRLSTERD